MMNRVIFAVFFLILGISTLQAGGIQEDRMAQAEKHIANKEYNEAILLLTQVGREDPERFEQTEALLSQIRAIRQQYNQDYETLINTLGNEEDAEGALRVIERLENLDPNPNSQDARRIREARRTQRLIFSRRRFNQIMSEAAAFLRNDAYGFALETYLEGYTLQKEEFDESEYGNILKDQVNNALAALKEATASFRELEGQVILEGQGLLTQIRNPTGNISSLDIDRARVLLSRLAQNRKVVRQSAAVFMEQNNNLKTNTVDPVNDFFLNFAILVTMGRQNVETEGVVGTMDLLFSKTVDPWIEALKARVDTLYNQGLSALSAGQWEPSASIFARVEALALQGISLVTLWNQYLYLEDLYNLDESSLDLVTPKLVDFYFFSLKGQSAAQALLAVGAKQENLRVMTASRESLEILEGGRRSLRETRSLWTRLEEEGNRKILSVQSLARQGIGVNLELASLQNLQRLWQSSLQENLGNEIVLSEIQSLLELNPLKSEITLYPDTLERAQSLIQGTSRPNPLQPLLSILSRYPLQALELLTAQASQAAELKTRLEDWLVRWNAEPSNVVNSAPIQRVLAEGVEALQTLAGLQTRLDGLTATSRANYQESLRLRQSGLGQVVQIESAIDQSNFTLARNRLSDATQSLSQSLSLQEDEEFRAETDRLLEDLGRRILEGENVLVIREVRELITRGKEEYFLGQFIRAEDILQRAQERWLTTNPQDEPEVRYWLQLTQNALTFSSGREVLITDPLYHEVRQLLTFTQRDYEKAKEALKRGNASEAKVLLSQAQSTLGKILLPFPLNQEAAVLNLRILELLNPNDFDSLFRDRFNASVKKLETSNPGEAYTELQDLARIQPNYEGMSAALRRAQIILRIIRVETNVTDRQTALNRIAEARRIFNTNNTANFNRAIDLVNQALQLDPENQAAQNLKTQLQLAATPGTQVVASLSATEQQVYQSAIDLFVAGRFFEAKSLVDTLLATPKNRTYKLLVDLKRRIDAKVLR